MLKSYVISVNMKDEKVGFLMKIKTVYSDKEFNQLIEPIISNKEYKKTKNCIHHGMNRYDHMIRVSYYSYKITKFCRLDYKATTRASALHDFFLEDLEENKTKELLIHPELALKNALQYFELNPLEQDIIKSHMFPLGKNVPKYLESWIVDVVDDIASIYEKAYVIKESMSLGLTMVLMMFVILLKK